MISGSFHRRSLVQLAAAVLWMVPLASPVGAAQNDPAADIQAQYETVLATLKKPPVAGVLVTEVGPESGAAAAGMRGGDIITEYYSTRITTLDDLREQVAQAVARHLEEPSAGNRVLVRVRRDGEEKLLQVPREALDIRAVEVQANVPGPRNPPPSLRGTLELRWKEVADLVAQEGEGEAAFRSFERTERSGSAADEEWIGWQSCKVGGTVEALSGTVEWHRITEIPENLKEGQTPPTEQTTVAFRLTLGDFKTAPAFVLDEVGAYYPGENGATISVNGKRIGERLRAAIVVNAPGAGGGGGGGGAPHENAAALDSVPQPALPWVAAAMPHQKDAALGIGLLSLRDLQSRPGYVLVARGLEAMPADPAEVPATGTATNVPMTLATAASEERSARGWRVDLVHVGVVIDSYWFSEKGRLLCMRAQGAQSVVSRRVANITEASLPMARKAGTRPATAGGATQP